MAADQVAAAVQVAEVGLVQESPRPELVCRHEEMSAQTVSLESRRRGQRTDTAIVERDHRPGTGGRASGGDGV
jgi:hypothetical protein